MAECKMYKVFNMSNVCYCACPWSLYLALCDILKSHFQTCVFDLVTVAFLAILFQYCKISNNLEGVPPGYSVPTCYMAECKMYKVFFFHMSNVC